MKITDVTLSILRTELDETVIPTHGAVDAMPRTRSGLGFHRRRRRRELHQLPHSGQGRRARRRGHARPSWSGGIPTTSPH